MTQNILIGSSLVAWIIEEKILSARSRRSSGPIGSPRSFPRSETRQETANEEESRPSIATLTRPSSRIECKCEQPLPSHSSQGGASCATFARRMAGESIRASCVAAIRCGRRFSKLKLEACVIETRLLAHAGYLSASSLVD